MTAELERTIEALDELGYSRYDVEVVDDVLRFWVPDEEVSAERERLARELPHCDVGFGGSDDYQTTIEISLKG